MEEIIKEIKAIVHHRLQSFRYLQQYEDDIVNDVYIKMHQATKGEFNFENDTHRFRYVHIISRQIIDRYHNNNGYAAGSSSAFFTQKDNTVYDGQSNNFFDENTINYFPMQDEMLDQEYEQKMVDQFLGTLDEQEAFIMVQLMDNINTNQIALRMKEKGFKSNKGSYHTRQNLDIKVVKLRKKAKEYFKNML